MNTKLFALLPMPLLATLAIPSCAQNIERAAPVTVRVSPVRGPLDQGVSRIGQDVGRVAPFTLPLPLPGSSALAPDVLRAQNPWNLPLTGTWKFQLTRGRITNQKQFQSEDAPFLDASSQQDQNPPLHAFDGDEATRWCASGPNLPEQIDADLGKVHRVQSLAITWENAKARYGCRVEGRKVATGQWVTLADTPADPGVGDGPLTTQPADVRYVRVIVTGASAGNWASIRECKIGILENGVETVWKPPIAKTTDVPVAVRDAFAAPGFSDAKWDNISVPSNWEMLGYSIPTYDTVDNTVGLYRRTVSIPKMWTGKRIYWHFDGALDGAEVWVNGQKAGYHESGYTAFEVDLTGLLRPGQSNLLAVRVSKTTPSFDADTGDFQSMGGIYRDTSLIAVPQTHVQDITVRTPLAANNRDATLETLVQVTGTPGEAVTLAGQLVDSDGKPAGVQLSGKANIGADGVASVSLRAPVTAPRLWSAEKPNLYYVVLQLSSAGKPVERVEQRFGFRQIQIKNNVVLWNGQPIKCTGICRHDFWSDKGFALTDKEWNTDLNMMKAANINAVRTSHYNHAARFLELCDEKGMYILDEVPYCWINDSVKDPAYAPYLLLRAQETLARDKNRPCVLAWSLGNENPMGVDSQVTLDYVKATDPTRPAFVSGEDPNSAKGQDWRDNHYPGPDTVDRDTSQTNVRFPVNYTEHPHTFFEKEAQDYDPGISDLWSETLIKTWGKLWPAPQMLGSFIWEWQSQGVADKNADHTKDFYYGLDHLRQENNKGIVDGYRHPKPEVWIVKMAYSPVVVGARVVQPRGETCTVPLSNHYSFTDLNELSCRFVAFKGKTPMKTGVLHINCAPLQSVEATFPAPAGMTALRLEFIHPDGRQIMSANLPVQGVIANQAPAAMGGGVSLSTQDGPDTLRVFNGLQSIVFDKNTGLIRSWRVGNRSVLVGGPVVNLGESKEGNEQDYFKATKPPVTGDAKVTAASGLGNLVRVSVESQVRNGATHSSLGTLTCTYDIAPNAEMRVGWQLNWTAPDARLWESGLKLSVASDLSTMRWSRDAYFLDYPAGHLGEPQGTCRAGDVLFRASKRNLHWLSLTNAAGFGVALLPENQSLVSRANPGEASTTLFASREVAGVRGLSGSWVDNHNIDAKKGQSLTGDFILRAIGNAG